jgi:hypothetical protein
MSKGVITIDDVDQLIQAALSEHALPIIEFDQDNDLYRVQPTDRGDDSRFYNRSSNSRYGDRDGNVGVCYVAGSGEAAVAETLQHGKIGPGNPVLQSEIESKSLHKLTPARTLKLVDIAILAANSGFKLDAIVASKGQEAEGYTLSQALSAACMKIADVDGVIYPSRVYPRTRGFEGCNLALFEGRETQLMLDSNSPLIDIEFSTGEVIGEILLRLKVQVE